MTSRLSSRGSRHLRLRPLALALACMGMAPALAQLAILPTTLPVVRPDLPGNLALRGVSVTQGAATMNILQAVPRAIAEWTSFSIGSQAAVTVQQPSAASVLLNRVVGGDLSNIAGSLTANGHVYLINPNGVLFSGGSSVSVGGLVASTLGITNDNFLAGGPLTFSAGTGAPGSVANSGSITVNGGGTVALFGQAVSNAGTINANGGVILLKAENGVLFAPFDLARSATRTAGLTVNPDGPQNNVSNVGNLQAADGLVTLQGADVSNAGIINADGGTVLLFGGVVGNVGTINARGGSIGLVAGESVTYTYDPVGDGLTTFKVNANPATLWSTVSNSGTLNADGGRIALMATNATTISGGVVNNGGVIRAASIASRNGEIVLDSGNSSAGVSIIGGTLSAAGNEAGLTGGSIKATGRSVGVGFDAGEGVFLVPSSLDVSSKAGGGSIELRATAEPGIAAAGNLVVGAGTTMRANATAAGNGGDIRLLGERSLRAHGALAARGGPNGGNGGLIETSGGYAAPADKLGSGYNTNGIRVDASAPGGAAGTWLVDPFDVDIVPGVAAGTLPANPFVPIASSIIQDGDINAALNGGTSVKITTGNPAAGAAAVGSITMKTGVEISNTQFKGPLTFQLDAHRSVVGNPGVVISSSGDGGPLNVVLNADANGTAAPVGGGQVSYSGSIYTNGGNVAMGGALTTPFGTDCSICLDGPVIDTRAGNKQILVGELLLNTGGSDANPGGAVTLTGRTSGAPPGGFSLPGVFINSTKISSSTGTVTVFGSSTTDSGVGIFAPQGIGGIYSTSGTISVTGVGSAAGSNSIDVPGHGVLVNGGTLESVSGDIAVRGLRLAGPGPSGSGVALQSALITALGSGDIEITGEALGNGAGVSISPFVPAVFGDDGDGGVFQIAPAFPASRVDGNDNVVLRASNDGSTDALVIDGIVRAAQVLDLRPGGVDALGNAFDRIANPITLGGAAAPGFAVSAAEFTRITAGSIVAGSNAHAGNIDVVGPLAMTNPLTLQNGGGGNITLGAAVSTPQLGLISAGNITQAPGAAITAGKLLARSSGGNVLLNDPANNVSVGTVAGGAAGRFEYVDANAVTLGPVSVTGFDAAGNLPQVVSATSMAADTVLVRTLSEDLSLASNVSSMSGTNLVAAARFQNLGANTIAGAPWRVWADTWVGETRGGLAGSGLLPNLYHCAFLGLCTVAVPPAANHFIYAQQPVATVQVGGGARDFGFPNPPFTYSITGLILGDTGAGFTGSVSTPATIASLPGSYPVGGTFVSAEGYAVNVVPGSLLVRATIDRLPKPDVLLDMPTTWLYDRNVGRAPICFATGPLEGDRAQQGNDALAREWSRVRSRPNLTSCVGTERRNGCADF